MFKKIIFYNSIFFIICPLYSKFYSQYGQDSLVSQYFKGKKDGFFVDVGAYDEVYFSNTYFFELLGWQGICIEPQPEVFQNLCKNRSAICINACITDVPGIVAFTQIICSSSPVVQMLSGMVQNFEERHAINVDNDVEHFHGTKKIVQIAGYPLIDVLDAHGVSAIDYLSIDIEGGELRVLQSIPLIVSP